MRQSGWQTRRKAVMKSVWSKGSPAAEGHTAPCGQVVEAVDLDPLNQLDGGDPLKGGLAVLPLVPGLGVDAELALQRTPEGPHQGGNPRAVGGHAETVAEGQGEGRLIRSAHDLTPRARP